MPHFALPPRAARIGLFGLFGCGNTGNDGSLEAELQLLLERHDRSELVCICREPERVAAEFNLAAVSMLSYRQRAGHSRLRALASRILSKAVDPFWVALVVRRLDVVVVPGMGVFEQQIRVRPWGLPYALFLLAMACKLSGTDLAFVSVGAEPIDNPVTRFFIVRAERAATFCSYRDEFSRRAITAMGGNAREATVCPDVVFAFYRETSSPVDNGIVGVGVMAYYGPTDDKVRGAGIHARYVEKVTAFVGQVLDRGFPVRLLTGDVADDAVGATVRERVLAQRPALPPDRVLVVPATTLRETMAAMDGCHAVVATRFHNVLCAVLLGRPVISLGYGGKHDDLMACVGLPEMSHHVATFESEWLFRCFEELDARSASIANDLAMRASAARKAVVEQHSVLERDLFGARQAPAGHDSLMSV